MTKRVIFIVVLGLVGVLAPQAQAAFPGEPGRLVYEDSLAAGFFTVDPDGSDRRPLLAGEGTRTDDPSVSPDGRLVVYSRSLDLWIAAADGSGSPRALTTGDLNDQGAVFSPDGTRVVFTRVAADDLFVINADGTGERNLTNDGSMGQEYEPTWSPDGTRIAYGRGASSGQGSIYSIPAEGGTATNLTPEQPTPPTCEPDFFTASDEPSWSPDGTRIAFTGPSLCPGGTGPKNFGTDIWIMAADGSGKTNVTNNDGPSESEPHWSPDGARIAVLSDAEETEGPGDLYVMNADGSGAGKIIDRDVKGGDFDWGPAPSPERIVAKSLTATVKARRRDGRTELILTGRLVLPTADTQCAGRLRIGVKRGKRQLAGRTVALPSNCRYKVTVRLPGGTAGTVKASVAFLGTTELAPARARDRRVRLR